MSTATRVLIGEDEALVAMDLEMTLKDMGYFVVGIGSSGESIIQMNREFHPDLILMDVRLEGNFDGLQAAEQIQKESEVPILFVTAGPIVQKQAKPIHNFLNKPFSNEKLQAAIRDLFTHRDRQRKSEKKK